MSVKGVAKVMGSPVTVDSDKETEKIIRFFFSINQPLYLIAIILKLLSKQINKNSSGTARLLRNYIDLTNGVNEVSTTFNAVKASLQGMVGIADPKTIDLTSKNKLPFTNPTIHSLLNTYDDSDSRNIMKVGLDKYQKVYKWAKLLCDKNAGTLNLLTRKSLYCPTKPMPSSKADIRDSLSVEFKDLNLTDFTDKAAQVKEMLDNVSGEKELMQKKAQANIAASIEMQNNTSQMYGILKNAMKKLSDFGSEK